MSRLLRLNDFPASVNQSMCSLTCVSGTGSNMQCTRCVAGWQGPACNQCTQDSVCGTGKYCKAGACAACSSIGPKW